MIGSEILAPSIDCKDLNLDKRKAHHQSILLMGCHFVLTAISKDPHIAWEGIRGGVREIQRIESLISSWKLSSETSKVNNNAGVKAVRVSEELYNLIERSAQMSQLTSGAFDISGTLSRDYWNFDKGHEGWPSEDSLSQLKRLVDFRQIELNKDELSVFLKLKGMKIGFGAIGKGYAAYRAYEVMRDIGVESGLVNASGDLMCWGRALKSPNWEINIPDPVSRKSTLLTIRIPHGSVVTSGNYEKYTLYKGKKYSHIIDPRTGIPIQGINSVSIVCPNPEFGDAIATAISVLGVEEGLSIVNNLNGVECLIVDADNRQYYSKNLNI